MFTKKQESNLGHLGNEASVRTTRLPPATTNRQFEMASFRISSKGKTSPTESKGHRREAEVLALEGALDLGPRLRLEVCLREAGEPHLAQGTF